jgi:hypothetical protein
MSGKMVMGKHGNKKVAPVIVAICLIGYYVTMAIILSTLNLPGIVKIAALSVSVIVTVVIIVVLVERIKEINGGEEDDLGQY